jgi:hypothetical protein
MRIVKHDAEMLGVSWITKGAPNMFRPAGEYRKQEWQIVMRREHQPRYISIVPIHAAGREACDFGGSSALNPTSLSFT